MRPCHLCILFSFVAILPTLHADVIELTGSGDPALDRPALQAAIDGATSGDTLRLTGTFLLDGEPLRVSLPEFTIEGLSVDDDLDGRVNEDWADGVDNDGDLAIDEDDWDAEIVGVAGLDGLPLSDEGEESWINRAVFFEAASFSGLVIRDLAFRGHHVALYGLPEWASPTQRCGDRVPNPGVSTGVRFERNRFTDNRFGIVALGAFEDLGVRGNLFTNQLEVDYAIEGGLAACLPDDPKNPDEIVVGTPVGTRLRGNALRSPEANALTALTVETWVTLNEAAGSNLFTIADTDVRLFGNAISTGGLFVLGGSGIRVFDNVFTDIEGTAVLASLSVTETFLFDNRFVRTGTGIYLDLGARGYRVGDNVFEDTGTVDVELEVFSSDNTVANRQLGPPTEVQDRGLDNRLLGNVTEQ